MKISKLACLSQDFINQGIAALENDDWEKQKKLIKQF